ncbi:hypothetical protein [Halobellus captivus]|uniref:hypothetical protein n=1 Tax=Halobellus captivus TaxID=2592614 RepID=UPI0011A5648A|nr:hypothetical protein [Halobellus captivus]
MSESDRFPTRCLVEDCDRGPFESKKALMGHVNGSAAPGHDWSEVKDQLEGGDPGDDDQSKAGDSSGDGETNNPGDEEAAEGSESAPEGDEEGEENDSDEDMPTEEEYQQQHDGGDKGSKTGDGSSDGDQDNQGGETNGSALAGLPMDPKTLGMLLFVAFVLWVSYRALSGSGGDDQPTGGDGGGEPGDGSGDGETEIQGGLTG